MTERIPTRDLSLEVPRHIDIRKGSPRNLARAAMELAIHLEADR